MDILKNLDIHIGTNADGRTVLLATKHQTKTEEFRTELAKLFDVKKVCWGLKITNIDF